MRAQIGDLNVGMSDVVVVARVLSKSHVVEVRGKKHATATIGDSTAQIKLNLWRNQVDQVGEGDLIMIPHAFVHWKGRQKQLSTWSEIEKAKPEDMHRLL